MLGETLRDRLTPIMAAAVRFDVDCASMQEVLDAQEHNLRRTLEVIADWLRSKAAQTLSTARQLSSAGEIEAVAVAKMLTALADSLTPTPAESTPDGQ